MAKFNLDRLNEIAKPRSAEAIRRAEVRRVARRKMVKVFYNLTYGQNADLCECLYCDSGAMLVPSGADNCPCCGHEGALAWLDEEKYQGQKEVNLERFLTDNLYNECLAKHIDVFGKR